MPKSQISILLTSDDVLSMPTQHGLRTICATASIITASIITAMATAGCCMATITNGIITASRSTDWASTACTAVQA